MTTLIDTLRRSLATEPEVRLAPDDCDRAALASPFSQAVGREVDVIYWILIQRAWLASGRSLPAPRPRSELPGQVFEISNDG